MSDATTTTQGPGTPPAPSSPESTEGRGSRLLREITTGNALISVLAVVLALVVSGLLIGFTDTTVQGTLGYFFSRPADFFQAFWAAVGGSYSSLFQGAIYNFRVDGFAAGIRPLTETLNYAVPLIAAGLGVAVAFRVGLFNIGARGQMLMASAAAGWVGFSFHLPLAVHLPLALAAGIAAGALWGGIVGLLKARTGAHEVILTIMLNYIAFYLLAFMLRTQGLLQAPGSANPKSPATLDTAILPDLFGARYNLNWGFVLVIVITAVVWWLINRSTLGFRFRAVGENPHAARTAGMNVKNIYLYAMLISGALAGVAGSTQVLGTLTSGFTSGIDAGIGFDAITVALLGRSRPWGVFGAGVLFGALKAGGYSMQAANGVPIDIVLVVQSLIVLFVAAPPLVRAIFRLPAPGLRPVRKASNKEAVVTK
ncbi:ABC transporter permease [Frigoribacterium sp. PhB24]|uniref:ABC transporter permease n=1 Tax=Frigoribacterium sp. PhB24 TaxID=2485204 RepID=UPI000F470BDD|nr:ABC transporter permease [Frigoribacterium sp. PhB24]ROS52995.1 nucleoside ABC transporter membrane protein [Frigoribacterium sp. PhB24]